MTHLSVLIVILGQHKKAVRICHHLSNDDVFFVLVAQDSYNTDTRQNVIAGSIQEAVFIFWSRTETDSSIYLCNASASPGNRKSRM